MFGVLYYIGKFFWRLYILFFFVSNNRLIVVEFRWDDLIDYLMFVLNEYNVKIRVVEMWGYREGY